MEALPHIQAIDTHVHVWDLHAPWMTWLNERPDNWQAVRRQVGFEDLARTLDASGIAELILVQAGMTPEESLELLALADGQPRILGVVGWTSLTSAAATEAALELFQRQGAGKLVGIRNNHRWAPDGDIIARPEAADACRVIARAGLVLDLHYMDFSELPLTYALLDAVPDGRYVIDHLGKPLLRDPDAFTPWSRAMETLSRSPNVFVKYSGWSTFAGRAHADDVRRYVERALELFGPDRLMYGSNWPVALAAADYATTLAATLQALGTLSEDDAASIFRGTAIDCYLPGRYSGKEAPDALAANPQQGW